MAKRDYYTVLGRQSRRFRRGDQEGLSQARDEAPSGPQSGRQGLPRTNSRRRRRPTRFSPTRKKRAAYDQFGHAGVDPSAGFGAGGARRRARRLRRLLRRLRRHLRRDLRRAARRARQRRLSRRGSALQPGARRSRKRRAAPRRRSASRRSRNARRATAAARSPARSPSNARRVTAAARCACRRASSRSSRRAPRATAPARSCPIRAPTCHGAGRIKKHKTLSVKIPAGVDQDDRIRLSGEGEAGMNGGPSGDLYVVVNLKPHPVFQREGADLHCEMPISFADRGARRRDRDPDARRPREDQDSGGDAERAGVPPAQQGHPPGPRFGHRRSLLPRRRSRRR